MKLLEESLNKHMRFILIGNDVSNRSLFVELKVITVCNTVIYLICEVSIDLRSGIVRFPHVVVDGFPSRNGGVWSNLSYV